MRLLQELFAQGIVSEQAMNDLQKQIEKLVKQKKILF